MKNPRFYGNPPFKVAVLHGGPGAAGEMKPVAEELSHTQGIIEPLQTVHSVQGQLDELKALLETHGHPPLTLIGYSWGAMLGYMFAAENPALVKKLVLVSSGMFTAKYAKNIMKTRLERMTSEDREKFETLIQKLDSVKEAEKNALFSEGGKIISKVDAYDPLEESDSTPEANYEIYNNVWPEADKIRASGDLLAYGKKVKCPVVAIHGDYDPHPYEGVKEPLSRTVENFKFILMERCGHTPWKEKNARDFFFKILKNEIEHSQASLFK